MTNHEPEIENSKPGMIFVWALFMAAVWGIALYGVWGFDPWGWFR
jgi:hypothetical protein